MRIRSVRAELASCPFHEPLARPFWNGVRLIHKRDMLLITVETEEGITGHGEGEANWAAKQIVEGPIAQ